MTVKKGFGYLFCLFVAMSIILFTWKNHHRSSRTESDETERDTQVMKVGVTDSIANLDPRQGRDVASATIFRVLYEGLMHHDAEGQLVGGVAKKVEISNNFTTYTFYLRDAYWSNGEPITAQDFVASWKSILNPHFPAPNAYQLYVIKNAKAYKEEKGSSEDVGIEAPDAKTLIVHLEKPTPYFLELIDLYVFYPVHRQFLDQHSSFWDALPTDWVSNGPFKLEKWALQNVLIVNKNPLYWNAKSVQLNKIEFLTLEENTALQMFETKALDWIGSPLSLLPPDAVVSLKKEKILKTMSAAGTYWIRFNTADSVLKHPKIRKGLSYAIDRYSLVEHIMQTSQLPAMGVLPPSLGVNKEPYFQDHNIALAQQLFEEGLSELHLTRETLPILVFSCSNNERSHKISQAIQQQWRKILDIEVQIASSEAKILYDNLKQKNYQMALGSWFADIRDPYNFLEVFQYKNNGTNNTEWEHPDYIKLLEQSSSESNSEKRKELFRDAETLLMDEMPIAPLYYPTFNFVKRDRVKGVYLSDLGYMVFNQAFIFENEESYNFSD